MDRWNFIPFLARNHQEAIEKTLSVTGMSFIDPYVSY